MIQTPARLVVLVSGSGTNLQAILDACGSENLPARVVGVISNKREAFALERARTAGVPAVYLPKSKDEERQEYDRRLAEQVAAFQPDWIILAGWMRILSSNFLGRFPNRVINLHPALPGTFPGTEAIRRAYEAFQRGEIERSGIMVHLVPDEGVDDGPVLGLREVEMLSGEPLEAFERRMHATEHELLVSTLRRVLLESDFIAKG
ncbi:MAG TPA: phosphoribosylglycinamide formyltransferase [Anaerolinea sp.]|nr:phosphoribosylglycinamide formyltransferase [Anaerolinea sp.]